MNVIERIFQSVPSFRSKQRLVIMLACSIVLIVTLFCFVAYSSFSFSRESRERLGALCDIIGADVGAALAFGDNQAVSKSLAALRADPSIKQLFVLNEHDQVIAYYHQTMDVVPDDLQQRLRTIRSKAGEHYFELSPEVERPIISDGSRLGTIHIEQDEQVITGKITASTGIGAVILLLTLGFSYLLADRFQRVITEPVTAMATTMQEVSYTKDFSMRVAASGTDEMDQLAERFNEMLSEIERRDADLLERQDQLHLLANFDALTELPNRSLLLDRIEQAMARTIRDKSSMALFFLDLDRFKNINDTLGHAAGDQLLIEVSQRLKQLIRTGDTVARLGGDEFVVVVSNLENDLDASHVAKNLINAFLEPFRIANTSLHMTTSIGIALFPEDGTDPETIMKNADMAMYSAKESGRNDFSFYSREMNSKAHQRMELEAGLRNALLQDEFFLEFQPIMNAADATIVAAEALVRWMHPTRGRIPPDQFISLAEETGLIIPLGEWVLRTACSKIKAWSDAGLPQIRVSVNVSSRQIEQHNFADIVRKVIQETGVNAAQLELELTESCLVNHAGHRIAEVFGLQKSGVTIAIDDFGTGYSSLSYIKALPIDHIKIDQTFVRDITTNFQDQAIVEAIIAMSQKLGIRNIAEGVETAEQLQILKNQGCSEIQGYYFHRPLSVEAFEELLREVDHQVESGTVKAAVPVFSEDYS